MRFRLRRTTKSRPRTRLGWIVRALVLAVVGFYAFAVVTLFLFRWVDPPVTAVQIENAVFDFLEARDEPFQRLVVTLDSIPLDAQHAVIAAEDGAFYEHHGVDWAELDLVLGQASDGGRLRGASTITQQLVKNLYLTNWRFPLRKLVEYSLVPFAELMLDKERILEIYLNVIEWGPNVWGVEAAARHHYGISASNLTRDQAARLAACIPSPRKRSPERMDQYSSIILERMHSRGW